MQKLNLSFEELKKRPLNDNDVLWRYMPVERLRSMAENSSLYFSNPKMFRDPDEGATTTNSFNDYIQMVTEQYRHQNMKHQLDAEGMAFVIRAHVAALCFATETLVCCW